jgi:hypothetical protein
MSQSGFDVSNSHKFAEAGAPGNALHEASKLIEQAHAEILKARDQVRETIGLIAELTRISAVFESVAEGLVDATFKASNETTRGATPQKVLLAFVEDLGDLARRAVLGAGDARREVNRLKTGVGPAAGPLQSADSAIRQLGDAIKQLADRPGDAVPQRIEVEYATPARPSGKPRPPTPLEEALTAGLFVPRGARSGFKN